MTNTKPILILSAGNTFPVISETEKDFDEWIAQALGNSCAQWRMDAREVLSLPDPIELAGVVISGSHAMVTDHHTWSEHLAIWLRQCIDSRLPLLGICYGHQLLAYAAGGEVGNRPQGIDIGTKTIALSAAASHDYLFRELPENFAAQLVHSQSVLTLPDKAVLLANSENEEHQAFRIGQCAWGVQFHPEFSASVMRGYIEQVSRSQGLEDDISQLLGEVTDTPEATFLLRRFSAFCRAIEKFPQ